MAVKLLIYFFLVFLTIISCLKLEQVLILGRHNIRAPLTKNLENFSPYSWPQWNLEAGYLTSKGIILEEHMGKHILEWLQKENLLPLGCPDKNDVFIYANTKQRTRESAKAFVNGAFKDCNITVYSINSEEMDPTFNPILRNTSDSLKETILKEMRHKIDNLHLNEIYLELDEILNLKESSICKTKAFCSFVNETDRISYEIGEAPNIIGPLRHSNGIIDSFIMTYYEGMPIDAIARGKLRTLEQWKSVSKIAKENLNVRFNGTALAKEVSKPLIQYIHDILSNNTHKLMLLVGHDSNLLSITTAMGFQEYELPERFEPIPIGSKLIFQKWYDADKDRSILKINFVYQTPQQLRNGTTISEENRPQWVNMKLKLCSTDDCSWDAFLNLLQNLDNT